MAVKDAGSGVMEVIKGSFQIHLKTGGWVKAKVVHRGRGGLKVSPSLTPHRKILIIHHVANLCQG